MVRSSKIRSGKKQAPNPTIELFKPHEHQLKIYEHPARFQVLCCGRRFGKTEFGKILVTRSTTSKPGANVAWISPTSKNSTEVWRVFWEAFHDICQEEYGGWTSVQEKTLILPNKSKLTFWSAENYNAMRGGAYDLVILEEAAMYPTGELWQAVVRPTLTTRRGKAYFLSTPRGRNWFYELYQLGDPEWHKYDPNYKSWHFSSNQAPHFPLDEFEEVKRNTTDRFFKQEYMAEFLLEAGEVFKGVMAVSIGQYFEKPYAGNFVIGCDLARKYDWTVFSVLDIDNMVQVDMVRLNSSSWEEQRLELYNLQQKWKPQSIYVENNFGGDKFIEDFEAQYGITLEPFNTLYNSKKNIIEALAIAIQNKDIILLSDPQQVSELQSFEMKITENSKFKFGAPYGVHDDCVMALAIAYHALQNSTSSFGMAIPVL